MRAHPFADKFPMLSEGELAELAESIAANGLRNPVVLTEEGLILDGRNRAAACARLGIEPETVVYEGDDLAEYVIDCNVTRRNMSTGARAMATALVLAEDGRRENGRWKRGSAISEKSHLSEGFRVALRNAGVVLDFAPELATDVVAGDLTLNAAYQQADEIRRSAEAGEIAEREARKAEREAKKKAEERDAHIIATLTGLGDKGTKYLGLIQSGDFTPTEAWAAYDKATEAERRELEDKRRGWRDTCNRIIQCVSYLDGGQNYGRVFLREFYPHESEFIPEGRRLTRESVEKAIQFLETIHEGLPR